MSKLARDWLPSGKAAAVCLTIDDIHPATSDDAYEAGGDLEKGALGKVLWLLERHPKLWVTLFTTADWREISARPTRKLLALIPLIREKFYLAERYPKGTMRLSHHPRFVEFLKTIPRAEIGWHGLDHAHRGPMIPVEFQDESEAEIRSKLRAIRAVFEEADLPYVPGMTPPGWNAPPALLRAMALEGLQFVASSRDILTPITPNATAQMSGIRGLSLLHPIWLEGGHLLHIPTNFQATSPPERAFQIVELGGLLSIKAHIVKHAFNHTQLDGVDQLYMNYLDVLLSRLEDQCGDGLWWTSMGEIARFSTQLKAAA